MEGATVSASHGAMVSVLVKLSDLLNDKYKLAKKAKEHVKFLHAELRSMHVFLDKMSDAEEPEMQDKNFAQEARELSYDIEDSVDEFVLGVECKSSNNPHRSKGFVKRSMNFFRTMDNQDRITKKFEELKNRLMEIQQRHTRFRTSYTISRANYATIDPCLSAGYRDPAGLVGIDRPRDELIQLMDEESVPAHQLKVLSIVGFGGLGKTTLAHQIYCKLEGQFQCGAFVSVSQKANIKKILRTILSQVGFVAPQNANMETWDEQELVNALQNYLLDKRYFIVIDDIWDVPPWEIIRCALPENSNSSRVITTTQIETLAIASCRSHPEYVYRMKPLSDQDSRRLFFKRVFGSEDACPPNLKEAFAEILKKCGGLPLAIVTTASSLASMPGKQEQQCEHVLKYLGSNHSLDVMRQILNLSYMHLPQVLKTCMLYMSIYKEDYTISKNDLTRQWVAEGFVSNDHGRNPEDVAKNYFNELVNRSIIQPTKTDYNGEVVSCRVHDIILELIRHKASEEKFMTVIHDIHNIQGRIVQSDKIRRLALHLDGANDDREDISIQLPQIRTLARFGTSSYLPPISQFKHLRTLIVEIPGIIQSKVVLDFTGICRLFQLRYLKIVAKSHDIVLPSETGNLLQLETCHIEFRCCCQNGNSSDKVAERAREILSLCIEKCCNLKYVHVNAVP